MKIRGYDLISYISTHKTYRKMDINKRQKQRQSHLHKYIYGVFCLSNSEIRIAKVSFYIVNRAR